MSSPNREITLRFIAQPTDANFGGKVHGGSAMKWLDEAGYACACGWSGRYCVTAFVGNMNFQHPISVGHLIELNAKAIHTGKSSMHIAVNLSSGDPKSGLLSKAMYCIMIFVAVDDDGQSVEVPEWVPVSEADTQLEKYAITIKNFRDSNKSELESIMEHQSKIDAEVHSQAFLNRAFYIPAFDLPCFAMGFLASFFEL
ncbi:MAG: acyl-CoA thioesterase [Gammaproteobacteria bacterium]|nr:MAG: acyl-CoA thioesterase [Gammaproteobacteria bacterium]